jgi:hypothetical protein
MFVISIDFYVVKLYYLKLRDVIILYYLQLFSFILSTSFCCITIQNFTMRERIIIDRCFVARELCKKE